MAPPLGLFDLPVEIREMIYDCLISKRRKYPLWDQICSQPRIIQESQYGEVVKSCENWNSEGFGTTKEPDAKWLSSTIRLNEASRVMQASRQAHDELSLFIYARLVWHVRFGNYAPPALPLQICPQYAQHIVHFRLHLETEDSKLQSNQRSHIKFTSFYKNLVAFGELLAGQPKFESLQVDAYLPGEANVLDAMDALEPLKGRMKEIRVGRLAYKMSMFYYSEGRRLVSFSNEAYQRLRGIFGDDVAWTFPFEDAQYKD